MPGAEEMKKIGKLHVLTDTVLQSRFSHSELAELAIQGGADTIQYRQRKNNRSHVHWISSRLKVEECSGSTRTGSGSEDDADLCQMGNIAFVLEVQYGDGLVHIQTLMSTR